MAGHRALGTRGTPTPDAAPTVAEDAGSAAPAPDSACDDVAAPDNAGNDGATPDDAPGENVALDALSATVTGPAGAAPRKGDALTVKLHVNNAGTHAGRVHLTVLSDSALF